MFHDEDGYLQGRVHGFEHGAECGKWDTIYNRPCDDYAVLDDPDEPRAYRKGYCFGFEEGYHSTYRLHAHVLLQLQQRITWTQARMHWSRAHKNRALLEPELFNTIASFFES